MQDLDQQNSNSDLDLEDEQDQESGVWLSISDLMSGLLLFFALLFITTQVQLQKKQNQLQKKEKELKSTEEKLEQKIKQLRKYQNALEKLPLVIVSKFKEGIGGNEVNVDPDTGDVSLDDKILFEEGKSNLKPKGKQFLNQFIPKYSQVIFSQPEFEKKIARIVIEGHTSSKGSEKANRDLSLERAQSVADYIFSDQLDFPNKDKFQEKVLISGRGEIDANQKIDDPKDRKVTFRFQLRRPDFSEFVNEEGEKIKQSIDKKSD